MNSSTWRSTRRRRTSARSGSAKFRYGDELGRGEGLMLAHRDFGGILFGFEWQPGTFIDHSVAEIRVEDFINRELILFSMADNVRYAL